MNWITKFIKPGFKTLLKRQPKTEEGSLWTTCNCQQLIYKEDLHNNFFVCPKCETHQKISCRDRFKIFLDNSEYEILKTPLPPDDPLNFVDTKKYPDRLKDAQEKTGLKDAVRTAVGKSMGNDIVVACMDFSFIGGSMGSVVGEKIARAADYSLKKKLPFIIISKSGGARMMEAALSLMQLAKTSAKLAQLSKAKIPYISLCTDPTTGGTTASFAMLGDINISEPGALIGFAGPRVVRDTTGKELPDGFQTAEFVLEHGFLDFISHRKDLKRNINLYIDLIQNRPLREKELA